MRYNPRLKIEQLLIEKISQASANQRSGRCGRIAPGICIRLYDEEDFDLRPTFTDPFGSGVGGWGPASIQAMDDIGIKASAMSFFASAMGSEYQGVRPTSFAAGLMLETGIVGLLLFILSFYPFIIRRELYIDIHSRSIVIFFLFNIFALGSIGDPIPFVFLALAYRSVIEPNSRLND